MNSPRRDRPERPLSDIYHDDDGVDPRSHFPKDKKKGHAAARLRSIARNTAELILSYEMEDPLFEGLEISQVTMVRRGHGVEFRVVAPDDKSADELELIKAKLPALARIFRSAIAETLQRRKALEVVVYLGQNLKELDD